MPLHPRYLLKLGTYTFPKTFYPANDPRAQVVPSAKLARGDGAVSLRAMLDAKRPRIVGGLTTGPIAVASDIRDEIDSMIEALKANSPARLFFGRDDRYLRDTQFVDLQESYEETGHGRIVRVEIELFSPEGMYVSTAEFSDTWTVGGSGSTRTVTVSGGNDYTYPRYEIRVDGAGAKTIDFTLRNMTTGVAFTLSNVAASANVSGGNIIVVDTYEQTVEIGGVDRMDLFGGDFPSLLKGPNVLYESYGANALNRIQTFWNYRWA